MITIKYELLQKLSELEENDKIQLIFTKNLLTVICEGVRTLHPITEQTPTIDLLEIINYHRQMRANQSPTLFGSQKEGVEL